MKPDELMVRELAESVWQEVAGPKQVSSQICAFLDIAGLYEWTDLMNQILISLSI
jgi:hypothetical protein